jgi:hypothetical protein
MNLSEHVSKPKSKSSEIRARNVKLPITKISIVPSC